MNKDHKIFVNGNWWESIHVSVPKDYMEHFDFIDLGAKQGKMRKFAGDNFGGKNGLHIGLGEYRVQPFPLRLPILDPIFDWSFGHDHTLLSPHEATISKL